MLNGSIQTFLNNCLVVSNTNLSYYKKYEIFMDILNGINFHKYFDRYIYPYLFNF